MPNNITTYTTCAAPGVATSHKRMGGFAGWVAKTFVNASTAYRIGIGGLIVLAAIALIVANPFTAIATFAFLIASLVEVRDWYFNRRLLCIENDVCAIGTVIDEAHNNFDGDAVFDIMLAPYTQRECFTATVEHLRANLGLLQDPAHFVPPYHLQFPDVTQIIDQNLLFAAPGDQNYNPVELQAQINGYLRQLRGKDTHDKDVPSNIYNQFLIGVVDRILALEDASGNKKDFYKHFFRKSPDKIPLNSPLWNAIPTDFDEGVDWKATNGSISTITYNNPYELLDIQPMGLNSLFRFNHKRTAPFFHCEIDGNRVSSLIDQIIVYITGFFLAYLAALLLPFPAGLIVFLIFLIALLIGAALGDFGPDNSGLPDVDYEEPIGEDLEAQDMGDVVVVHGNWIMDTEHSQYFEIHPVKAYYIVGKEKEKESAELFESEEERIKNGFEKFENHLINETLAKEICAMISDEEGKPPSPVILKPVNTMLSYGMNTFYGGGAGVEAR